MRLHLIMYVIALRHVLLAAPPTTVLGVPFTLFALLINIGVGVLLPTLVAFVTNKLAASWFKGLILLALSTLSGALTQLTTISSGFDWRAWILSAGETFAVAVLAHYGVTKGLTSGSTGVVARRWSGGLGRLRQ